MARRANRTVQYANGVTLSRRSGGRWRPETADHDQHPGGTNARDVAAVWTSP